MTRIAGLLAAAFMAALFFGGGPTYSLTITNDLGGRIDRYEAMWRRVAASGEFLEIQGTCHSACTMFAGVVPSKHVCVGPGAVLSFHASWDDQGGPHVKSAYWTARAQRQYPGPLKAWIRAHGGLSSPDRPILLTGSELRGFYRACP